MTDSLWRKRQEPDQYAKGYADAMNWKTANHLEHLPVAKYSDIVSDGGLDPRNTTPPQRKPLTDEMVTAAARVLNERQADACGVDRDDQWAIYSDDFKADALAMLKAAHGIGNKA